jgi:excisionase family DNA binding protein
MRSVVGIDIAETSGQPDAHFEQTASALSICRTKVYELIRTGELESVQIGASRRIPVEALKDYVRRLRMSSKLYAQRDDSTDRSMS